MFFFFHKILVLMAALSMFTGVCAAVFFRHNRYWFKIHKVFNSGAVIFLSSGVILAVTAIWQQKGEHLDGFHPVAGSVTLVLAIISLILGFYQFRAPKNRIQVLKTNHRWLGRFAVLLLIIALISGLFRVLFI